ncbi:MAG: division/cell wall cluster transcriptional repressor MraZ, partial [bacterium]
AFPDSAFLAFGEGGYIKIIPKPECEALIKAYDEKPRPLSAEDEWELKEITRSLTEVPVKGKGRLSIPKRHKEYANLKGGESVMLIGVLRHCEIWSSEEAYNLASEKRKERTHFLK